MPTHGKEDEWMYHAIAISVSCGQKEVERWEEDGLHIAG